jgi:hypothetical protein
VSFVPPGSIRGLSVLVASIDLREFGYKPLRAKRLTARKSETGRQDRQDEKLAFVSFVTFVLD